MTTTIFKSLYSIVRALAEQLRPPERMTVAQSAAKYRFVNQPGAYVGPWLNSTTPYLVEPMNIIADRMFSKMAFVAPAQAGKTDALIINGLAYSIRVDPIDTMVFCPTSGAARDFSIRRVDRLHRNSPEVGKMLLNSRDADNVFDKRYITGMMLTLSYPSVTELAGRPVGRILMTDFDRMDDDIGGDGNPFDLASKRTTTFGSFAMCAAESSPSREITDPQWIAKSPNEAPPTTGILALYNRGDRRRWQWPCLHCWQWFEGKFEHLTWETDENLSNLEKSETVKLLCPNCGGEHHPDDRHEMQMWGMWVPEFCHVDSTGKLVGKRTRTDFASFWLRGTAATFTSWQRLVLSYLDASDDYQRTYSEDALKKFWNNDMGEPYVPKNMKSLRLPEVLKARSEEFEPQKVPEGVRFLVATVDVQNNRFSVQVTGIMEGKPYDTVVIDRFEIIKSKRLDPDGDPLMTSPPTYLEDWDLLIDQVINKEYELADGSGRQMRVKMTGCDSGGAAGSTNNAYDFYRSIREKNLEGRFILIKGDHRASNPRTRITLPDSQRKNNKSAARGEIPVLMINSNVMKDALSGRLDCTEPGKGMYHMPNWLPDEFYSELCVEVRTDKGWENPNKYRNEAFDLSYYALGLCASPLVLAVENLDWDNPPGWAKEWDKNDLVRSMNEEMKFAFRPISKYDFGKMAEHLA